MNKNIDLDKLLTNKKFYEGLFIGGTLFTFLVWIISIFVQGSASQQFNIFFAQCGDFLADTLNVVGYSSERDPYHNMMYQGLSEKAYPPLVYMVFYFFSRLVDMQPYYEMDYFLGMYFEPKFLIILIILTILQMLFLYEWIRSNKNGSDMVKMGTALAFLVSAPVLFSIERGNTIIMTVVFAAVFLMWYDSENPVKREIAIVSLAFAAAIKMTPAFLGILLLYKRQWKEAVRAIIYGLVLFFAPFLFFEGGLSNFVQMLTNFQEHFAQYSILSGTTFVATIYNFIPIASDGYINVLKVLAYVVVLLLLYFCLQYKEKWEIVMAVSMILLILPAHSEYYCILYLIPPVVLFLNAEKHEKIDFLVLIGALFITNDIRTRWTNLILDYHLGMVLILIALFVKGFSQVKEAGAGKKRETKVEKNKAEEIKG